MECAEYVLARWEPKYVKKNLLFFQENINTTDEWVQNGIETPKRGSCLFAVDLCKWNLLESLQSK